MSDSGFRVAHLSDFHRRNALPGTAAAARRRSREPLLERALEAVSRERADLIVITGDLLDVPQFLLDGIPRGFQGPGDETQWLDAVREDYRAARRLLEATGIPFRVLPGNHDHETIFAEVFHDQGSEWVGGGYRWITFRDYEQEGHRPRRLGASRHLFRQVLNDADTTPQVHLQHYLLHTPPTGNYPYAYAEAEGLRERIAAAGRVRLTLSGHYHDGRPLEEERGTIYTVAEAICDAPHRWRLYEMTPSGGVTVETHSLPAAGPRPAIFLDRDGVINDIPAYTGGPEEMRLIPGSAAAIRRLNEAGRRVIVVTSQSAIGMGFVTDAVVQMVNERMQQLLANEGAFLDAIYYTAGAGRDSILPGAEAWPTAKSGLIEAAFAELALQRDEAVIVGDRLTDIEAGREAGIPGILVLTGFGARDAAQAGETPVVADLSAAVDSILRRSL